MPADIPPTVNSTDMIAAAAPFSFSGSEQPVANCDQNDNAYEIHVFLLSDKSTDGRCGGPVAPHPDHVRH
jgi:hypothetical protein